MALCLLEIKTKLMIWPIQNFIAGGNGGGEGE